MITIICILVAIILAMLGATFWFFWKITFRG